MVVINKNRSKFEASTPQFSKRLLSHTVYNSFTGCVVSRYHADEDGDTSERFSHFAPGSIR